MTHFPWQNSQHQQVLWIIDADHSVDEKLLNDWLDKQTGFSESSERVVVRVWDDAEDTDTSVLRDYLKIDDNTLFVPLRVVWRTAVDKVDRRLRLRDLLGGNPRRPNRFKARRILQTNPNHAVCLAGKPALLADLKAQFEQRQALTNVDVDLAGYIIGQASLALDVAERRLRGSRYKVPRQVTRQIRASHRFQHGLQNIADEAGKKLVDLRPQALAIFKELVSTPHHFWLDIMAGIFRKVISMGYEDKLVVDRKQVLKYRQIVREHPTAILWTHKTHMDGPAMQTVLFENDFPTPHIVGGINMAMAGLGYIAKRAGAIFIRRSFQGDVLYKLILRNYLAYLLEKRFPLTWSFEGTRSRVGKLMPPRYGILKYVMEAVADSSADELYILPVAINYDMINDVKDYAAEQSGGVKRPESLSWLISYLRRLRQPLGRVFVDFGEPVIVARKNITDDHLALAKTAFQVGVEANRVTPITLTSLMAMSLLGAAPRAQTMDELRDGMSALRNWAAHRKIRFTSDFEEHNNEHMLGIIDAMVNSELLTRYDEGPETVYAVAEDQHPIASYYRNTIVHHFVIKAMVELSLLHARHYPDTAVQEFWKEAAKLRDYFKFEFFYASSEEFQAQVRSEMAWFDADWEVHLAQEPAHYIDQFLLSMLPLVAHAVLKPFVEAYRIVADVYTRLAPGETLDDKAAMSAFFKYARQAYLQRRISSKASIGKLYFGNGLKLLDSLALRNQADVGVVEQRKQHSKYLRILAHRLDYLRSLAMPHDVD